MTINYTLHHLTIRHGCLLPPALPIRGVGTLALDTASAEIKGPCWIRITCDERVMLDAKETTAALDTATAQYRCFAGNSIDIPVESGSVYLKGTAGTFADMIDVGSPTDIIDITPTLDTNTYAAGDVLYDFQALASAVSAAGRTSTLQSLTYKDKADTGVTITHLFAEASAVLGTVNAAPSISDSDSFKLLGHIAIAAADILDLGGNRLATLRNLGLMLKPSSGTTIYNAAMITVGGTGGTFAASDIEASFGFYKN